MDRLKSVLILNAATWLVFLVRQSDYVKPLLRELYRLRVPECIQFWLCIMAYHCLNGMAPSYLADGLRRAADVDAGLIVCRLPMCLHCSYCQLVDQPWVTVHSLWLLPTKAWNNLPSTVPCTTTLSGFRQ